MKSIVEFEVDAVVVDEKNNIASIDGKCTIGPIGEKNELNVIYKVRWVNSDDGDVRVPQIYDINSIECTVSSIYSFRRYLPQLSQGYTATIQVKGNLAYLEMIKPGLYLAFHEIAK